MKVLLAPDKFKGSLTASEAAVAMAAGVRLAVPHATIDLCPVADGGEGTVAVLVAATGGRFETRRVVGPLPHLRVDARFGLLGDGRTAVVEMAAASGLALLKPEDYDPLATTTFGTGELLVEAAKLGVRQIILGLGGSATNDCGIGCAHAAGLPVLLADGEPTSPTEPLCGRDLDRVVMVKRGRGSPLDGVHLIAACDVTNPLYGHDGAAAVYGPQKGATPDTVSMLDASMRSLAVRLGRTREADTPGAGAAGGLGFGVLAFFDGTLGRGADLVLDAVGFSARLAGVDLCLTGEGRLDRQSLHGKAPLAVAAACRRAGVPCVALAGTLGDGWEAALDLGLTAAHAIADAGVPPDVAMRDAGRLLTARTADVLRGLRTSPR